MSDNKNETKPHSQDFFGEYRNFWWNADFLELMSKRWELNKVTTVLDVGCGIGHWGRTLMPFLPKTATVTGIDMEPNSILKAQELAEHFGIQERCHYSAGLAQKIPFPDNSFDMVTCQTVLIHVPNVPVVLREMLRVLKPGGLLAVAEPNNMAAVFVENSANFHDPVETKINRARFALTCEKGKMELGLGNNSIGDLIPGMFSQAGLSHIQTYLSDKASPFIPPYETPEQQANLNQYVEWANSEFFMWGFDETLKHFLAGGGTKEKFDVLWNEARAFRMQFKSGLLDKSLHTAGGVMFYLISGRKS